MANETFYVVYDSKFHDSGAILFLVDRKKDKTKWGSILMADARRFTTWEAADRVASSMYFGNPRVISEQAALDLSSQGEEDMMHSLAMDSTEFGWDGHKDSF